MKQDGCAWSYFLPRLGPSPISTPDFEIATGPELFLRCGRTLRQLRQIVTTIVTGRGAFVPLPVRDAPAPFLEPEVLEFLRALSAKASTQMRHAEGMIIRVLYLPLQRARIGASVSEWPMPLLKGPILRAQPLPS